MEASQEVFEVNAVGHALWENNDKQHISAGFTHSLITVSFLWSLSERQSTISALPTPGEADKNSLWFFFLTSTIIPNIVFFLFFVLILFFLFQQMDKVSYVSLWEETTAQRRARTNLIDIAAQQIPLHVLPLRSRRQCDEIWPVALPAREKERTCNPSLKGRQPSCFSTYFWCFVRRKQYCTGYNSDSCLWKFTACH